MKKYFRYIKYVDNEEIDMTEQYDNPDTVKLNEVTLSNLSPQIRMNCIVNKTAYKSTNAVKLFYRDNNKLFEMYWHPGMISPDSGTNKDLCAPQILVRI